MIEIAYSKQYSTDAICQFLEREDCCEEDKELLASSLYYYCCGWDATPIVAFGAKCPLYVYADNFAYISDSFQQTTSILYDRLRRTGYELVESRNLCKTNRIIKVVNAMLTKWRHSSNPQECFHLLYLQGDGHTSFRNLYHCEDGGRFDNYILPKCICNIEYEWLSFEHESRDFLSRLEKKCEYVMGHCYSDKYEVAAKYNYNGLDQDLVPLYRRRYWFFY